MDTVLMTSSKISQQVIHPARFDHADVRWTTNLQILSSNGSSKAREAMSNDRRGSFSPCSNKCIYGEFWLFLRSIHVYGESRVLHDPIIAERVYYFKTFPIVIPEGPLEVKMFLFQSGYYSLLQYFAKRIFVVNSLASSWSFKA
jgi:hypothetical protein